MNLATAFEQPVLGAAADPEQLQLPIHFSRVTQCAVVGGFDVEISQSAAERADPGELVEMSQAGAHRLAAAHRKPGDGSLLAIGDRPEFAVDEGHQVVDNEVRKSIRLAAQAAAAG